MSNDVLTVGVGCWAVGCWLLAVGCWRVDGCVGTLDENADTCAARNYHSEMVAHHADSTLMLVPVNHT